MSKAIDKYRPKFGSRNSTSKGNVSRTLSALLDNYQQPASPHESKVDQAIASNPVKGVEPATSSLLSSPGVEQTRRGLATCIEAGDLTESVLDVVFHSGRFAPIEGTLIDYKRDLPRERLAQLKTVKHIASFHNTFGGYLVFGAEEAIKDVEIIPVHTEIGAFDFKVLRDLCREYLTEAIEIQSRTLTVTRAGASYQIALVHIPTRRQRTPVLIKKDARDAEGKYILRKDDACLREGDNSISASNFHHWEVLFGPRINPYIQEGDEVPRVRPIPCDLPDRDFICAEFIGRLDYLSKLFAWLTDDFTCVRVLAGEGGLGKTSIAFQFATEVAKANLVDAEMVIWLTAKRMQFRALSNEYEELVNRHFSSSRELFIALAENLDGYRESWEDIADQDFPKLLRKLGQNCKVFFVVDDLDSLEIDEQKRCIEVCQQLAGLGSRFLFTTRKNATASTSTAIEVQGLEEEEYEKLVQSWQGRLQLAAISPKDVKRLRETTHGSPLYTESLLRLVRTGWTVGEAIAKWKGNLGVDVRNAALKREVTQLGHEARRVLVATAVLGECSLAEIKVATDYSDQTLLDATNELQSLFLVYAPSIASQQRFSISKATKDLIISIGPELIADFTSFQEKTRSKRHKAKGENTLIAAVGVAVNQAMALISAGDPEGALRTVDEVNQSFKSKNRDLWFLRGRVLLKFEKPRLQDAKAAFAKAFDFGQRKLAFFGMWYDTTLDLEQFEGAVEVCNHALASSAGSKADWLVKRANARVRSAALQDKRGDMEHTINQLERAADDFFDAAMADAALKWDSSWKESLYRTHDSLWAVETRMASSLPHWLDAFDLQTRSINRGDHRLDTYARLKRAFDEMRGFLKMPTAASQGSGNLIAQSARRGKEILIQAPKEFRAYKLYRQIEHTFASF